jgi:hypothetical protein
MLAEISLLFCSIFLGVTGLALAIMASSTTEKPSLTLVVFSWYMSVLSLAVFIGNYA